jgi:hypothetical protein
MRGAKLLGATDGFVAVNAPTVSLKAPAAAAQQTTGNVCGTIGDSNGAAPFSLARRGGRRARAGQNVLESACRRPFPSI